MHPEALIAVHGVNHFYGSGALRRQILFDVSAEIRRGEIVILTGPSGSGKTTLLTLVGALRSTQDGSLRVFGEELRGAPEGSLVSVRKRIGYIFQAHNLLESLSARQNVMLALQLHPDLSRRQIRVRADDMLHAVGLGDRLDHRPAQLSGGQKQRVAIARALASQPQVILADEPTASLDKASGRDVVNLMQDLARRQECTVVLVTHDNRILDIADRILHLEDGRVQSFSESVLASTQHLLRLLAQDTRKGALTRRLRELPVDQFVALLDQVTAQFRQFLQMLDMSNHDAFESMLEQVLEACTVKVGEILEADRATLFLVDRVRNELWSKVAGGDGERQLEIRIPLSSGIAGHVARTGSTRNIPDAYDDPLFNPSVDRATGYRTRSILCVPILNQAGATFAVAQLLNRKGGVPFSTADERRFQELAAPLGVILESWWQMSQRKT
jgi:putative ABC transport system ATP-binding protein